MRTALRNIAALSVCLSMVSLNGHARHQDTEAFGDGFRLHYRGFVQADHVFFFRHGHPGLAELTTSHGIQILPQLFVGTGSGINLFYAKDEIGLILPIFLHIRSELLNRRFSPYVDTKIGHMSPGITTLTQDVGYHVYFGNSKMGLSLGVGYNLLVQSHEGYHASVHGLNAHLTLDF